MSTTPEQREMIKKFRDLTGFGIMESKIRLSENGWDIKAAIRAAIQEGSEWRLTRV